MSAPVRQAIVASKDAAASTDFGGVIVSVNSDPSAPSDGQQATDRSITAAANSTLTQVDNLTQFAKAFGNNPNHLSMGVMSFDRTGHVIAGASLDGEGDLSVYGSGSSGSVTSAIGMSLQATSDGRDWASQTSLELAQATYALNAIADSGTAQIAGASGVDKSV